MNLSKFLFVLSTVFSVSLGSVTPEAQADLVTDQPGLEYAGVEGQNIVQFSGYLNIESTQKKIHYWYIQSESDPVNDPVVFWTNGGPGCSGLLGLLTEQGPFKPTADGKLIMNDWRWNRIANMVFLEQPVGVGYSYSTNSKEYHIGDDQTALDNVQVILEFHKKFPQFKNSETYITSESYGGHYMPTWAYEIIKYNKQQVPENRINFKGFAVGNPYTDFYSGTGAMMEAYWDHQLIARPDWDRYVDEGCLEVANLLNKTACSMLVMELERKVGNLNPYALNYPVCVTSQQSKMINYLTSYYNDDQSTYEPCEDNYATTYMNRPDVKTALHVNPNITWEQCSSTTKYNVFDRLKTMQPYYNKILNDRDASDVRILVYSGDNDAVCATKYTNTWIWNLGYYHTSDYWKAWSVDSQVAGYLTQFKTPNGNQPRLTFMTVHGAGHEVPTYKPKEAFALFEAYLNNDYNGLS